MSAFLTRLGDLFRADLSEKMIAGKLKVGPVKRKRFPSTGKLVQAREILEKDMRAGSIRLRVGKYDPVDGTVELGWDMVDRKGRVIVEMADCRALCGSGHTLTVAELDRSLWISIT